MTAAPAERRVRVTLEGMARQVAHAPHLLRVRADGGSTVLVDSRAAEVEDVQPERTWTDGDVVQHSSEGWTLTRDHGRWVSSHHYRPDTWTDDKVTRGLIDRGAGWGHLEVLRYQAGDE